MTIQFFCPRWGAEHHPFDIFCKQVREAGYDGIEMSLPPDRHEKRELLRIMEAYGLLLVAQHWETVEVSLPKHLELYANYLYNLAEAQPLFINSQSGKDFFSFEQNGAVLEKAAVIARETGVKIIHETHRGKFSFCTTSTLPFLAAFPDLRLTADFSHWCNVAETYLQDQPDAVQTAIERTDHIHSRVGFPEGPQVSDPRAPEWETALGYHLQWWDAIVENHRRQGSASLTITTEFGPAPYLPLLPYTQQPVVSQWDVNVYMKDLLKKRYRTPA